MGVVVACHISGAFCFQCTIISGQMIGLVSQNCGYITEAPSGANMGTAETPVGYRPCVEVSEIHVWGLCNRKGLFTESLKGQDL